MNKIYEYKLVMSYKKKSNKLKGVCVKWDNNKVFPEYTYTSGPVLSNKTLVRAKKIVIDIMKEERNKIENAFLTLAKKKYKGEKKEIRFDYETAIKRIYSTKLGAENEYCYGESDEKQIWIFKNKIPYDILVGTILHEALHYFAYFNNKEICEKDEHAVMRMLGDDC